MTTAPIPDGLASLLQGLEVEPPASEGDLRELAEYVSATYRAELPEDYVAFLRMANGADGEFGNGAPIVLWTASALPEANTFGAELVLPGCLLIGSDAGDGLYGIDLRSDAPTERYVDLYDGPEWDLVLWRGDSFLALLRHISRPAPPSATGVRGVLGRLRRRR